MWEPLEEPNFPKTPHFVPHTFGLQMCPGNQSGRIGKQVFWYVALKKSQNRVALNCKSCKSAGATLEKAGSVHDRSSAFYFYKKKKRVLSRTRYIHMEWKHRWTHADVLGFPLKTDVLLRKQSKRTKFASTEDGAFSSISCQIRSQLVRAGTGDWPEGLRHPLLFLLITTVFMALLSIPGTRLSWVTVTWVDDNSFSFWKCHKALPAAAIQ